MAFVAWLFRLHVLRNGGIERVNGHGPVDRPVRRREGQLLLSQSLLNQLEQFLPACLHGHGSISEASERLDALPAPQFGQEPVSPFRECRKSEVQNQRRPDEHRFLTDEQQSILVGIANHLLRQADQVPQWTPTTGYTDGTAKARGCLPQRDNPLTAIGIYGGEGIVVGEGGSQRADFRIPTYDGDQMGLAVLANPGAQMDPDVRPRLLRAPHVNQFSKSFMRIFHRLSFFPPFP